MIGGSFGEYGKFQGTISNLQILPVSMNEAEVCERFNSLIGLDVNECGGAFTSMSDQSLTYSNDESTATFTPLTTTNQQTSRLLNTSTNFVVETPPTSPYITWILIAVGILIVFIFVSIVALILYRQRRRLSKVDEKSNDCNRREMKSAVTPQQQQQQHLPIDTCYQSFQPQSETDYADPSILIPSNQATNYEAF